MLILIPILIGMILIFLGVTLMIVGMARNVRAKAEGGFVLVLGPFPIVFATNVRIAKILLVLGIVLTLISLLAFLVLATGWRPWINSSSSVSY